MTVDADERVRIVEEGMDAYARVQGRDTDA